MSEFLQQLLNGLSLGAIYALIALGYPKPVAEKAVLGAMREEGESSIQAVLKRSLKRLSR